MSEAARVLVVDDNEVDREAVRRLLGAEYAVLHAATGTEGLARCRAERPTCVVLDYQLPDQDGVAWLPRFLEQDVGVVMLTGAGDERIAVQCLRGGAHDYLSKHTLTRDALVRAVRNAVDKAQLVKEVALHRRLFAQLPVGVLVSEVTDVDDPASVRPLWANPAALDMLGLPTADLGHPLDERCPELLATYRTPSVVESLRAGRPALLPELRVGAGAAHAVREVRVVPLGAGLVASIHADISQRVEALEQHREMEAQMIAAQRMEAVGRLAGGVAHDFNNVLTVVQSYAWFLREQLPPNDPGRQDATAILDASARAANLTRQLLAFSRRQVQDLRVVDPAGHIVELERLLRRLIPEDVELRTALAPRTWAIRIDATHLEQVVVNLVVNAKDAMSASGTITISTSNVEHEEAVRDQDVLVPPGQYAEIAVRDDGCGMDEATRAQIFEPFFTTKPRDKGTGLGLSTVYGIVKQSRGFVFVDSEPGVGTTFRILFPRVDEAVHPPAVVTPSPELGGTETVLLVEDEDLVRKATARLLRRRGYQVLEASNGSDALAIAEGHEGPIPVMVTDMVMPELNGKDLAERIGEARRSIRVIYMSGYTEETVLERLVSQEEVAFVQKPFTPEALLGKIRAQLDRSPGPDADA